MNCEFIVNFVSNWLMKELGVTLKMKQSVKVIRANSKEIFSANENPFYKLMFTV